MKTIFSILFVCSSFLLFGQATFTDSNGTIIINKNLSKEDQIKQLKRGSYVESHILGDSVTYGLNQFEKSMVYFTQSSGAYAIEQKRVIKPVIYKKIYALDEYYIKSIAAGKLGVLDVRPKYVKILAKASKLVDFDTKKVEQDLKKLKDPEQIEAYFLKIKFNEN